ncbi:hypothetical protein M501DRAFT_963515 [Patellaria atrata CBS 101060]|uniref:RRM domain-containing protein n=1 Tax=Patellaria atrata CBS 101060 TaxID=1346257 RepID=A0A9P4S2A2_9PEZI|nr:hypothetical protein M501DRAFT_963515 [Patellaria atrata CBS 101060]
MSGSKGGGRAVFVGNIPYGVTEETIIDHLSRVGQVVSFRLVYDKETGRPKGFGFAEYADADAAASAVRNLNDHELMGRNLRVDYSNDGGSSDAAPAGYTSQAINGQETQQSMQSSTLPPLPPGADLPPDLDCPDAISRTLSTLSPPQLLDILSQMKGLVSSDPVKATELLKQAPQLSYAIFQALLLLGLVDTSILTSIVEQPPAAHAVPVPPPPQPQLPVMQKPLYPQVPHQMHAPTPPVQAPYQPTPAPPPAAAPMGQEDLIRSVLSLSQQQIDGLAPNERNQIMALRQQFMMQYGQR